MTEYKTERVDPAYEDSTLRINAAFGWQLIESQEVYNESTKVTGANVKSYGAFMQGFTGKDGKVDVKTHTDVTNYIAMRFGRDTLMPDYDEITALEKRFYEYTAVSEPKKPTKRTVIAAIGTIIIVISVILAIINGTAAEPWEIGVCVAFPLIFIPYTILGWTGYRRKLNRYNNSIDTAAAIMNRAINIIDGKE